jgi:8-oxo-dGTP pyrophosphatase MutT (NUDIX family)
MDPIVPSPRPSGTVIVVHDDAAPRVLMLRRQPHLRFMGGFWVFPGGAVDAGELEAARGDAVAAAARAAARELHEEAGVRLGAEGFVHWAHWITPSAATRRFDTHFFVATVRDPPPIRLAADESSDWRWIDPADFADAVPGTEFPLTPPTILVLRELAVGLRRHAALDALLRAPRTIHAVLPKLSPDDEAVMPWDPAYPSLPGEGVTWPEDAVREREGWPSRLGAAVERTPPR